MAASALASAFSDSAAERSACSESVPEILPHTASEELLPVEVEERVPSSATARPEPTFTPPRVLDVAAGRV